MNLPARPCLLAVIGLLAIGCESEQAVMEKDMVELPAEGKEIVEMLDGLVIPVVNFENASLEEAIDFLRMHSSEIDPESDPNRKGVSFIIQRPGHVGESGVGESSGLTPHSATLARSVTYAARNVRILDALSEVARQGGLDVYLTSVGIIMTPEGVQPFPNPKSEEGEIWKVVRQTY